MNQIDRNIALATWPDSARPRRRTSDPSISTAAFADLARILWKRRALVLATAAVLGCAAIAYAIVTPPLYRASTLILVEPRDRQVAPGEVAAGAPTPDEAASHLDSQVRVIASDTVLGRAVERTGLDREPGFGVPQAGILGRTMTGLREVLAAPAPRAADPRGRALDQLRRKLTVERADAASTIEVSATAADPDLSARIANAVADAYLADLNEARAETARRAADDLRGRTDALRKAVALADRRLSEHRAARVCSRCSMRLGCRCS